MIMKLNLFSIQNLFFILGFFIAVINSELDIPKSIYKFFTIYLLTMIGLKGGMKIAEAGIGFADLELIVIVLSLCFLIPFIGYLLLTFIPGINIQDKVVVASQYGSVSIATFASALSFLDNNGVAYSKIMIALCALMEIPARFTGMIILSYNHAYSSYNNESGNVKIFSNIISNGSIVLLCASILIGYLKYEQVEADMQFLLKDLFYGILCFFLLNMGMTSARGLIKQSKLNSGIVSFAILMPVLNVVIAILVAKFLELKSGDATLLMTLFASASYIVVPTVFSKTLKQSHPNIYIPLALGITFPLNIVFGIPIYLYLSSLI